MSELDEDQSKIALHRSGPALILAGAGSGKTTSVIHRAYNNIMFNGSNPRKMVLMTFTNKAAYEMRCRLHEKLEERGYDGPLPLITTYHSFGHRIITKNPEVCHRRAGLSLLDDKDATSLKREILGLLFNKQDLKPLISAYSFVRNEGLDPLNDEHRGEINKIVIDRTEDISTDDAMLAFREYEKQKEMLNVVDFDDLVNLPIKALTADVKFRERVVNAIEDITIDEAQDNNVAQYKLLSLICDPRAGQTILLIGDDDQSIHRWRGAHPEKINAFIRDYDPKIFLLERNYRSTHEIVSHATQLIRCNEDRLEKNPYSIRDEKGARPIDLSTHKSGVKMANAIAADIRADIKAGVPVEEIAVLYRTNKMARLLEPGLMALNIPYYVKRGVELLGLAENKMIICACRLAVNPSDKLAFKYISQMIPGLGQKRFEELMEYVDVGMSNEQIAARLPAKAQAATLDVLNSITKLKQDGPESLYSWAINSNYFRQWIAKKSSTVIDMNKPVGFDEWSANEEACAGGATNDSGPKNADCEKYSILLNGNIKNRLMNMKLVQQSICFRVDGLGDDIKSKWTEAMEVIIRPPDGDDFKGVALSTIHSAKGLEWDTVHIAGFSEGLLPLTNHDGNIEDLTEERCLAYVGMTRAKNKLMLHHPQKINLQNGRGSMALRPSRFILEAGLKMNSDKQAVQNSGSLIQHSPRM